MRNGSAGSQASLSYSDSRRLQSIGDITMSRQFITIPEAGRRLGKSPSAIRRLIAKGLIDSIQPAGSHARVEARQVDAFLPARLRTAPASDQHSSRLAEPAVA